VARRGAAGCQPDGPDGGAGRLIEAGDPVVALRREMVDGRSPASARAARYSATVEAWAGSGVASRAAHHAVKSVQSPR
jgi:hypothetical protein